MTTEYRQELVLIGRILKAEEKRVIPPGVHYGQIIKVEYRDEPYEYVDFIVTCADIDPKIQLKHGCPNSLTQDNKLWTFLELFGAINVNDAVDPEKMAIGHWLQYQTINKKSEKNGKMYANIVDNSFVILKGPPEEQDKAAPDFAAFQK